MMSARISCDSLVALGAATAEGGTIFAKNSDRPALECQPLALFPAAGHVAGSRLRCQYIEIPQVERTLRVLGSRPFWLWGLEHGVNEAGVAVGNHTVFTRDQPQGEKLIGMDLVRLALERADNAEAAAAVICELVERHGQGGSGYHDAQFPYHSSFLIADRARAYLVETSDRRWAMRRIETTGSATNHLTIGIDWDALSPDAAEYARASGWWWPNGEARFDFAAAYRDTSWVPPTFSSGRYRRTCEMLAAENGAISEATMRRALRDHYHGPVYEPRYAAEDERYLSVCMHADPIGATTSSAVVSVPSDQRLPIRFAACLGPPCIGIFIPLYVEGELPEILTQGGETADPSAWWRFRRLLEAVEKDWPRLGPRVRAAWDRDEAELAAAATPLEHELRAADVDGAARRRRLTEFMGEATDRVLRRLAEIEALVAA